MEKVSSELFTMTYGALVMHLIEDLGDLEEVNKRLDSMGYNMVHTYSEIALSLRFIFKGTRITDELLAKAKISHCQNFGHTAEIIAKVTNVFKNRVIWARIMYKYTNYSTSFFFWA